MTLTMRTRGEALSGRWASKSIRTRSGVQLPSALFDEAIDRRSTQPASQLLDDLHDRWQLGWDHIATVAGVSRQAVHKWHKGESKPTRQRWRRIVQLAALAERVEHTDHDVARWFTTPIPGSMPPLSRLDFATVGRFDLLVKILDGAIDPAKAALAALPGRPRPMFVTRATVSDSGVVVVELPELGVFGHGSTLEEAEADLLAIVAAVVETADPADASVAPFRPYVTSDDVALRRALFGR